MSTTTVSARIDSDVKTRAEAILSTLGINHTTAINALYSQIVLRGGLPFELCIPNKEKPSLNEIRDAVRTCAERYGLERVRLFGSYARGEASASSDIDVLVDKGSANGFALGGFQYDLSQELGCDIDVVSASAADDAFLKRVEKDAVLLYER